jgi:hypothetical protein
MRLSAIKLGCEGSQIADTAEYFAISIGVTILPQFTAAISSISSACGANSVPVRWISTTSGT